MKLTKLSKVILVIIGIIILSFLIYVIGNIRYVCSNTYLLNITNGEIISSKGFHFNSLYIWKKLSSEPGHDNKIILIQTKDNKIKVCKFVIFYENDNNWIIKNKRLPNISTKVPSCILSSYILNSTCNYTLDELLANNRQKLNDIIHQYYDKMLDNTGFKILQIYVNYPLLNLDDAAKFNISLKDIE